MSSFFKSTLRQLFIYFIQIIIIMNLELKKFDIASITSDKVCVFIGKRETGKSFLVKDLLYYHRSIPIGTVISGTESANSFYSNHILTQHR